MVIDLFCCYCFERLMEERPTFLSELVVFCCGKEAFNLICSDKIESFCKIKNRLWVCALFFWTYRKDPAINNNTTVELKK
jgi:hypothetical protein